MPDVISRLKTEIEHGPRGRISVIASETGIKVKTLRNVYYGVTKNIGYDKAQKLDRYFSLLDAQ